MNIVISTTPDFIDFNYNSIPNVFEKMRLSKIAIESLRIKSGNGAVEIETSRQLISLTYDVVDSVDGNAPIDNQDLYTKLKLIM